MIDQHEHTSSQDLALTKQTDALRTLVIALDSRASSSPTATASSG